MKKIELINWQFSEYNKNIWCNALVPGTVHTDLLHNKIIEEPFYNDNENSLGWICETDWVYKTVFDYPDTFDNNDKSFLVFEGLDTVADITLSGKSIINADNMFLQYEADVTNRLKKNNNELIVHFKSPLKYARAEEKTYGKLPVALNSERVYIRKAQYSFGWDWGPSFPTSGIWKPVYLVQKNKAAIKNVYFATKEANKKKAVLEIKFGMESIYKLKKLSYRISLKLNESLTVITGKCKGKNEIKETLGIQKPLLWFPAGYGEQPLYELNITLLDADGILIDTITRKVGIRTVELQQKDKGQNTFRFLVNGKPVFAKGTNWIPSDSFLTRTTYDKYYALLKAARDCNQNIIRVWGGGFYENDQFYDICDELGLMVWHDFMFACGGYPEHNKFIETVQKEITQNVNRLQHHASIVIWCGNNENEWIYYQTFNKSYKDMPGYKLFSQVIPSALKNTDPSRNYWESSPFSSEADPNSENSGNRHQWNIWSNWTDYNEVINDKSLFVTEFGFQGTANQSTLDKFISPEHRSIQSRIFEFHNKQIEGNERVIRFIAGHLPLNTNWTDFIYLAQLNQGFALKTCLEHWIEQYPKTNGTIIWQLNDCWPVTSWALIDSELKPKLAYHFVRSSFAPFLIILQKDKEGINATLFNNGISNIKGNVLIKIIKSSTGEIISDKSSAVIISAGKRKNVSKNILLNEDEVLIVSFYDDNHNLMTRNCFINSEWKYYSVAKAAIKLNITKQTDKFAEVDITTDKPAYFVDVIHSECIVSDRGFILLPGETKKLIITKSNDAKMSPKDFSVICLNNYL